MRAVHEVGSPGIGGARRYLSVALAVLSCVLCFSARSEASPAFDRAVEALSTGDDQARVAALEKLTDETDDRILPMLWALRDGALYSDGHGAVAMKGSAGYYNVGAPGTPAKGKLEPIVVNNKLRRALLTALAAQSLRSKDVETRLEAAEELAKRPSEDILPLVEKALGREKDSDVRQALEVAAAQIELHGKDAARRLKAVEVLKDTGDVQYKADIERLLAKDDKGEFVEHSAELRDAAAAAVRAIDARMLLYGMIGHLFYGLSLGSVLLLAALGLAITFGLMRVINMAHGEMLMLGAYATYSVQNLFQRFFPSAIDYYLVAAVPVAFVVTFAVGVVLERTVVRFLYGRPLETLLATWGISLVLIQAVRLTYGAQNVTVANPSWLSGGIDLVPGVVLTYSRLAVIAFGAGTVYVVWHIMNRSNLGLQVRAVTQNREMAASMGIATQRVDVWTFGLGSAVAGLGGVALSQLGNVGPDLGQRYIVDSFMVVVLGGVGKLAGAVAGAMGLGIVNKLLEPAAGAVLGKILILGIVILFIQKRPQGIFALKGRAAEA